ncbi:MAG: thermonuclease family protein [Proteobacteria bacterium]|nr:thermonuclease family protein [Pseudomonadota bacterium]
MAARPRRSQIETRRSFARTTVLAAAITAVLVFVLSGPQGGRTLGNTLALITGRGGVDVHVAESFRLCERGQGFNCVIDGDTIRYHGERIRLADIDAPETYHARCDYERSLGVRASSRLLQLIDSGPFDVVYYGRDRDRYGRDLRLLERDGKSLGAILVREGLARDWDGARHPWC